MLQSCRARVLLVCSDGGLVSLTVSLNLSLAGHQPFVLAGGQRAYRQAVQEMLSSGDTSEVAGLRYILITGPEDGGRQEAVSQLLQDTGRSQVLHLEQFAQGTSQSNFESKIFFSLRWKFSADKELTIQLLINNKTINFSFSGGVGCLPTQWTW